MKRFPNKYVASALLCFVLGAALFLVWAFRPKALSVAGYLSFTFVGLTNDSSGAILAQFKVANAFSRTVQLGVNEVQLCQSNSWPNWIRNPGNWFSVTSRSALIVSVPAPTNEGCVWRVPLSFIEDQRMEEVIHDKAMALARYGLAKVTGRPFPGIRTHPWSLLYSPEMPCLSNELAYAVVARLAAEPAATTNAIRPLQ